MRWASVLDSTAEEVCWACVLGYGAGVLNG